MPSLENYLAKHMGVSLDIMSKEASAPPAAPVEEPLNKTASLEEQFDRAVSMLDPQELADIDALARVTAVNMRKQAAGAGMLGKVDEAVMSGARWLGGTKKVPIPEPAGGMGWHPGVREADAPRLGSNAAARTAGYGALGAGLTTLGVVGNLAYKNRAVLAEAARNAGAKGEAIAHNISEISSPYVAEAVNRGKQLGSQVAGEAQQLYNKGSNYAQGIGDMAAPHISGAIDKVKGMMPGAGSRAPAVAEEAAFDAARAEAGAGIAEAADARVQEGRVRQGMDKIKGYYQQGLSAAEGGVTKARQFVAENKTPLAIGGIGLGTLGLGAAAYSASQDNRKYASDGADFQLQKEAALAFTKEVFNRVYDTIMPFECKKYEYIADGGHL